MRPRKVGMPTVYTRAPPIAKPIHGTHRALVRVRVWVRVRVRVRVSPKPNRNPNPNLVLHELLQVVLLRVAAARRVSAPRIRFIQAEHLVRGDTAEILEIQRRYRGDIREVSGRYMGR